ncbi:MAG: hypothetical protein HY592_01515 [Candidatus Omnitrophica bacterium]|nr:hypothetical protein [Candidatus Omnitrophota bacterium]
MFSEDDFKGYFQETEDVIKKTLVFYTDLLNEVQDRAVRNKLLPLMTENVEMFRWLKKKKEKLF